MIPAKIYPVVIPAGQSAPLLVEGEYFKVLSSTGTLEITGDTFGQLGEILPGQGLENTRFKRLTLRDTSGGINTVQLLVAGEKFVDDRITGEVSIIDGNLARTRANQAFLTQSGISPVTATNNGAVQFYNADPLGFSVIERVWVTASTVCGFCLRIGNSATGFTLQQYPTSKLGGGASPVQAGLLTAEGTAWGPCGVPQLNLGLAANQTLAYEPKTPIVLPYGWRLTVQDTAAVTHTLTVAIEHVQIKL